MIAARDRARAARDERARAAVPEPGEAGRRGRRARRAERGPLRARRRRRLDAGGVRARSASTRRERGPAPTSTSRCCGRSGREDPASFEGRFTSFDGDRARDHAADRGRTADLGRRQHRRRPAPGAAPRGRMARIRGLPGGDARRCGSELARIGEEVGRDPDELELSVARGLMPPGREEESFVPDRRMLGGSAEAIVDELGAIRRQGVEMVLIQVSLLAPLVPEALEWVAAEVLPKLPRLTAWPRSSLIDCAPRGWPPYYVLGIAHWSYWALVLSAFGAGARGLPAEPAARRADHRGAGCWSCSRGAGGTADRHDRQGAPSRGGPEKAELRRDRSKRGRTADRRSPGRRGGDKKVGGGRGRVLDQARGRELLEGRANTD